jgi:hypothetical protein
MYEGRGYVKSGEFTNCGGCKKPVDSDAEETDDGMRVHNQLCAVLYEEIRESDSPFSSGPDG